ncbi:TPA: isoprenoid biosynthesis glyoxalase ElbB [Enterobacter roggenkampii]
MRKVAVVLAGCGVFDGSEINEVVLTLLSLEERCIAYECFAPDEEYAHVIDHYKGRVVDEKRNVLVESARIVRGNIKPIAELDATYFDALVIPGGFGVAKNLSDFAFKGASFCIKPYMQEVFNAFKLSGKYCCLICISPVLATKIYSNPLVTIGEDASVISAIEENGGHHKLASHDEVVLDSENKIITTPAYMLGGSLLEARIGIDNLISKLKELM